jgi:hypothetical protein
MEVSFGCKRGSGKKRDRALGRGSTHQVDQPGTRLAQRKTPGLRNESKVGRWSSLISPERRKAFVGLNEEVAVLSRRTPRCRRPLVTPQPPHQNRAGESSADVRSDSRTSLASTVILHSTTSFLTEHPTSAACQINRRAGLIPAVQRPHGTAAILASCGGQARGVFGRRGDSERRRKGAAGTGIASWTSLEIR